MTVVPCGERHTLSALAALARSWWNVDRIRLSPAAGKFLRLESGDLLKIEDGWYQIESRRTISDTRLKYFCAGRQIRAELEVVLAVARNEEVLFWNLGGSRRSVHHAEIEIYRRSSFCPDIR